MFLRAIENYPIGTIFSYGKMKWEKINDTHCLVYAHPYRHERKIPIKFLNNTDDIFETVYVPNPKKVKEIEWE